MAHHIYQTLGKDGEVRCKRYRMLLKHHIDEKELDEIRKVTNKAWMLGNDKFRTQIESLTKRQAAPKAKGGDRKSLNYRESSNQSSLTRLIYTAAMHAPRITHRPMNRPQ